MGMKKVAKGYKYKGFKLGQTVKHKETGKIVKIIGFILNDKEECSVAIEGDWWKNSCISNADVEEGVYYKKIKGRNWVDASDIEPCESITEIIAGVDKVYEVGEYKIEWKYAKTYEDNYSILIIGRGSNKHIDTLCIGQYPNLSIEEANERLKSINIKIVEPESSIRITTTDGEEIEISKDKAKELGFKLKEEK